MARSERRAAEARRKAAVRRYLASIGLTPTGRNVGIRAATRQLCSCHMCGHCREHNGPTMQERRAALGD